MKTVCLLVVLVSSSLIGNEPIPKRASFFRKGNQIEMTVKNGNPSGYFLYLFDMSFTMLWATEDVEDALEMLPMFLEFFSDEESDIRSACIANGWSPQDVDNAIESTSSSAETFQQAQDFPSLDQFTTDLSQLTQYANYPPRSRGR